MKDWRRIVWDTQPCATNTLKLTIGLLCKWVGFPPRTDYKRWP